MTTSSPERLFIVAGETLYVAGDAADRAYLVLSGAVDLTMPAPDGSRVVRGVGDVVGGMALVDDSLRQATAVAAEDCELLVFSIRDLSDRMANIDPLVQAAFASMASRYSEAAARTRAVRSRDTTVQPAWITQAVTAQQRLSREHEIRGGLARNEFELFFQPIVHLGSGRLAGMEALMRWRHPRRGLLQPAAFIPLAESCGVISDITTRALREVGALFPSLKAAAARSRDGSPLFVSVNVSGHDLLQPAFAATTTTILCDAGVDPADVKLEVTESILMTDADRCMQTLQNCRDQGFAVAIDDFGTGYSSLHYLSMMPITDLKMDRSFCGSLLAEAAGAKIIEAILRLGRELGVSVIAEGVETLEQHQRLHAMGCPLGQGYLFGPPVSHEAMLALIARETVPSADAPGARPIAPAA